MLGKAECNELRKHCQAILKIVGRELKKHNAIETVAKAKANGSYLGRRKIRNDASIRQKRKLGMTMREIAKSEGISTTVVQRSLKELK